MNKILCLLFLLFVLQNAARAELRDFVADELKTSNISKPFVNLNYDYTGTKILPIELRITEKISTKNKDIYEGKKLDFIVKNTVTDDGKIIVKANEKIQGEIRFIISSGMNGIPAMIVLDNFVIPNVKPCQIKGEYQKSGFDRTAFVLPLKWALTILPPTGSLTNFIYGGHAKITPKTKIVVYYYPEWK